MGVKARVIDGPFDPKQARNAADVEVAAAEPAKAMTDTRERRKAAALASLERNREALALLSKA